MAPPKRRKVTGDSPGDDPAQDICQVCKSDRYLNPNMKLLVSPCYHRMCESCIDRLFKHGSAPCPVCQVTLRRSNFVLQVFDDLTVEKEVRVRKKVGRLFNKRPEDFLDLRSYNDYLEEVEEIIFNLTYEVDVQKMEAKIDRYRQENAQLIAANNTKAANDDKASRFRLEMEKRERRERYMKHKEQSAKVEKEIAEEKKRVLVEMASGNKSAESIMKEHEKLMAEKEKALAESLKVGEDDGDQVMHPYWSTLASKNAQKPETPFDPHESLYVEEPDEVFDLEWEYAYQPLEWMKKDEASQAGGFRPEITIEKALRSAFAGLLDPTAVEDSTS